MTALDRYYIAQLRKGKELLPLGEGGCPTDGAVLYTAALAAAQAQRERTRRRQTLLGAAIITLALLAGVVGTSLGLWRADSAGRKERTQRSLADHRRVVAEAATQRAERQFQFLIYLKGFLDETVADANTHHCFSQPKWPIASPTVSRSS